MACNGEVARDYNVIVMFCKRCRYNLQSIDSRACPECGLAFDPGNKKTFRKGVGWPKWLRRISQGLLLLLVMALISLGVVEWRYQREVAAAEVFASLGGDVKWTEDAHQWAEGFPYLHERLQYVSSLYLLNNQLTTLPPEIGMLSKLTGLELSFNQIAILPPEIGKLTRLTVLYIGTNQLNALPPEIGKLTKLTQLDLDNNQLVTLPPEVGKLTNLDWLCLSRNQLTQLSPSLWSLTNLTTLYIDGNQVVTLPPDICKLLNLTELYLYNNQLTTLPPEIGKLTKLAELDVSNNPITDADLKHLKSLGNLGYLNLKGTKVTRQGLSALRLALPKCDIESDFD